MPASKGAFWGILGHSEGICGAISACGDAESPFQALFHASKGEKDVQKAVFALFLPFR